MHLYFYAPPTTKKDALGTYQRIKDALASAEVWVSTNTEKAEIQASADVMAVTEETDVPILEHMDAFIIEGTQNDPEIGFLLAHALTMKKPTLYLYRRGTVPMIFSRLSEKELPSFVTVSAYHDEAIPKTISTFLESIEGLAVKQTPRIKFTLRITRAIEEYLHFKTHNTKLTKADYLRAEIEKMMALDEGWNEYRRRRRTV